MRNVNNRALSAHNRNEFDNYVAPDPRAQPLMHPLIRRAMSSSTNQSNPSGVEGLARDIGNISLEEVDDASAHTDEVDSNVQEAFRNSNVAPEHSIGEQQPSSTAAEKAVIVAQEFTEVAKDARAELAKDSDDWEDDDYAESVSSFGHFARSPSSENDGQSEEEDEEDDGPPHMYSLSEVMALSEDFDANRTLEMTDASAYLNTSQNQQSMEASYSVPKPFPELCEYDPLEDLASGDDQSFVLEEPMDIDELDDFDICGNTGAENQGTSSYMHNQITHLTEYLVAFKEKNAERRRTKIDCVRNAVANHLNLNYRELQGVYGLDVANRAFTRFLALTQERFGIFEHVQEKGFRLNRVPRILCSRQNRVFEYLIPSTQQYDYEDNNVDSEIVPVTSSYKKSTPLYEYARNELNILMDANALNIGLSMLDNDVERGERFHFVSMPRVLEWRKLIDQQIQIGGVVHPRFQLWSELCRGVEDPKWMLNCLTVVFKDHMDRMMRCIMDSELQKKRDLPHGYRDQYTLTPFDLDRFTRASLKGLDIVNDDPDTINLTYTVTVGSFMNTTFSVPDGDLAAMAPIEFILKTCLKKIGTFLVGVNSPFNFLMGVLDVVADRNQSFLLHSIAENFTNERDLKALRALVDVLGRIDGEEPGSIFLADNAAHSVSSQVTRMMDAVWRVFRANGNVIPDTDQVNSLLFQIMGNVVAHCFPAIHTFVNKTVVPRSYGVAIGAFVYRVFSGFLHEWRRYNELVECWRTLCLSQLSECETDVVLKLFHTPFDRLPQEEKMHVWRACSAGDVFATSVSNHLRALAIWKDFGRITREQIEWLQEIFVGRAKRPPPKPSPAVVEQVDDEFTMAVDLDLECFDVKGPKLTLLLDTHDLLYMELHLSMLGDWAMQNVVLGKIGLEKPLPVPKTDPVSDFDYLPLNSFQEILECLRNKVKEVRPSVEKFIDCYVHDMEKSVFAIKEAMPKPIFNDNMRLATHGRWAQLVQYHREHVNTTKNLALVAVCSAHMSMIFPFPRDLLEYPNNLHGKELMRYMDEETTLWKFLDGEIQTMDLKTAKFISYIWLKTGEVNSRLMREDKLDDATDVYETLLELQAIEREEEERRITHNMDEDNDTASVRLRLQRKLILKLVGTRIMVDVRNWKSLREYCYVMLDESTFNFADLNYGMFLDLNDCRLQQKEYFELTRWIRRGYFGENTVPPSLRKPRFLVEE